MSKVRRARVGQSDPEFGRRLRQLRRHSGLNQVELSLRAGLSKSYISFLESGERQPSREVVLKLASILLPDRDARHRDELLMLAGLSPEVPQRLSEPAETEMAPAPLEMTFGQFLQHTIALLRQGDYSEAQRQIETGFTRFRRPAQLQTLLAHLELAQGHYEHAVIAQETALRQYDLSEAEASEAKGFSRVDFLLNLGVMYFLWADQFRFSELAASPGAAAQARAHYEQALKAFGQGLRLAPGHLYLLDETARVHFNLAQLSSGAQAEEHWQATIRAFRAVLAHPDRTSLPWQALAESAAFLAMAYCQSGALDQAGLLLDALSLTGPRFWLIPYVQACYHCQCYAADGSADALDQALNSLKLALRLDADASRAQARQDRDRELRSLALGRPEDFAKVVDAS